MCNRPAVISFTPSKVLLATALFALMTGLAQAQMYAVEMTASEWKLAATPFSCSLTHNIPTFGKAVLARKSGGADSLVLESSGKVSFPAGLTGVETLPPVWRNDLQPQGLGVVVANNSNQPLNLDASHLSPVIAQLNAGIKVMFSSQPISSPNSSAGIKVMRVVLDAKNFAPAYKNYQQCLADMIPYSLEQVARTTINYAEKPEGLTQTHKASLLRVARYLKADPKVVAVYVDGHADNRDPEAGLAVSQQQAEAVTAYLDEQGVPADKITTRWHGDKFPLADNKTPTGRAQNRRVTVRLEDQATRAQNEKKAQQKAEAKAREEAQAKQESADKPDNKPVAETAGNQKASAEKTAAAVSSTRVSTSSAREPSSTDTGGRIDTSGGRKLTPEQLNRMVEGLDVISNKPK
jgi:outer membrane protein OmpA-like peptidoglycan-associated protein